MKKLLVLALVLGLLVLGAATVVVEHSFSSPQEVAKPTLSHGRVLFEDEEPCCGGGAGGGLD